MKEKIIEMVCPHCRKKNKVFLMIDDNFNDKEPVHCDYCGLKIDDVLAGKMPRTEYIEE